jgi:hypothetical protein
MSAKKMLAVLLTRTNAVLGVATRRTPGAPPAADLVGAAMLVRTKNQESGVAVPADELTVKEVDYVEEAVRLPLAHVVDQSGVVFAPASAVSTIGTPGLTIKVTVAAAPPADCNVLVVVDGGPNRDPLKFIAKTTLNQVDTDVAIAGVPPGSHMVLASVDGYASKLEVKSFT